MAEVNEEIVAQYLKIIKKWCYVIDIPFRVPRGNSNIDLLAYNPKHRKYYDIEVKFRSAATLTRCKEDIDYLVNQFHQYKEYREKKLQEYTHGRKTIKVIVTTYRYLGKSVEKHQYMEEQFYKAMKRLGYKSEIWYFDDMIPELVEHVDERGRYNTQLLQTIRMLKIYDVIESEEE